MIDYVNSKIVEYLNEASLQEDMNEIKKKYQEINQEYDEKEKYRISEIQDLDYRELDQILNQFKISHNQAKISHNLEIKSATTTSELKK